MDEKALDGHSFLSHLRAAGTFDGKKNDTVNDPMKKTDQQNENQQLENLDLSEIFDNSALPPTQSISVPAAAQPTPASNLKSATDSPNVVPEYGLPPPPPFTPPESQNQLNQSPVPAKPAAITNSTRASSLAKSPKKHARGVSWAPDHPDDVSSLGGGGGGTDHQRKLTLEDMSRAVPFVEEAEANIIRALEQQESQRNFDLGMDAAADTNLLPGVPDVMAHDFAATSPTGQNSLGSNPVEGAAPRSQTDFRRSANSRSTADEERRPLVKQHERPHRRTKTVEDTLAGLSDAMASMNTSHRRLTLVREDSDLSDGAEFLSDEFDDELAKRSKAHAFADNALHLHEKDEKVDRRKQARNMWGVIRQSLPATLMEEAIREDDWSDSDPTMTTPSDTETRRREGDDVEAQRGENEEQDPTNSKNRKQKRRRRKNRRHTIVHGATDKFKQDLEVWQGFFRPRRETIWAYCKLLLFYILLPLVGVSACLFYVGENPIRGINEDGATGDHPSISWWLLFATRQVITLTLAFCMQGFIIDFLALGSRAMIRIVGPIVTLLIVQSKGWPFIFFFWGIFNFAMNYGSHPFAYHWLFWQDAVGMFNEQNPSGHVVDSPTNATILKLAVSISAIVAVKRFLVGLYLGRQTFHHYGHRLAKTMNKMVLVSEISNLAKEIERAKSIEGKNEDQKSVMTVTTE